MTKRNDGRYKPKGRKVKKTAEGEDRSADDTTGTNDATFPLALAVSSPAQAPRTLSSSNTIQRASARLADQADAASAAQHAATARLAGWLTPQCKLTQRQLSLNAETSMLLLLRLFIYFT